MIRSYEFQFAKGTFLWIGSSLSNMYGFPSPVGHAETVWITAGNLAQPDVILVLLYVVSMYISTKMSAVDPTQAEQQKMMAVVMPVMFAFIFAGFPSAFLLYWLAFNVIQTVQQYLILSPGQHEAALAGPVPQPEVEEDKDEDKPDEGPGPSSRRRRRRR
jgi:YidC/Oxa1 family membrane protein insertase